MRIAISSSCLTVIILLLVMIHCSIINKNYRDIEVNAFNNSVSSDGTFTVSLMYTDTEASTLDILITDEYSYGFMNHTGKTTCQRSIQLN